MHGIVVASLGVAAFILAASETFAGSAVVQGGGLAPPPRPTFQPSFGRSMHHRGMGGFWPTTGGVFYGAPGPDPMVDVPPPPKMSDDIRFTCVYDIPWDYVHRCPQPVAPRE
jgi:hypothetical protein